MIIVRKVNLLALIGTLLFGSNNCHVGIFVFDVSFL
jgi:hypothetical protein